MDELRKELANWLEFLPGDGDRRKFYIAFRICEPASRLEIKSAAPSVALAPPPAADGTRKKTMGGAEDSPTVRAGRTGRSSSAGAPAESLFESCSRNSSRQETLEAIREDLGDCRRCRLSAGRKTIVFGQGNPHAEVVFVGEGPGADEDAQGLPFVGRAGKLLNRMIQLVGMKREEVYICNVVKCRPPGNRTPQPDEIETCSPFLVRQIQTIGPRLICCLGAPAVRTVLGIKEGITKIRGTFYDFGEIKALPTVHPAYILRNPREEKLLREDFQKIADFLKSPR